MVLCSCPSLSVATERLTCQNKHRSVLILTLRGRSQVQVVATARIFFSTTSFLLWKISCFLFYTFPTTPLKVLRLYLGEILFQIGLILFQIGSNTIKLLALKRYFSPQKCWIWGWDFTRDLGEFLEFCQNRGGVGLREVNIMLTGLAIAHLVIYLVHPVN